MKENWDTVSVRLYDVVGTELHYRKTFPNLPELILFLKNTYYPYGLTLEHSYCKFCAISEYNEIFSDSFLKKEIKNLKLKIREHWYNKKIQFSFRKGAVPGTKCSRVHRYIFRNHDRNWKRFRKHQYKIK